MTANARPDASDGTGTGDGTGAGEGTGTGDGTGAGEGTGTGDGASDGSEDGSADDQADEGSVDDDVIDVVLTPEEEALAETLDLIETPVALTTDEDTQLVSEGDAGSLSELGGSLEGAQFTIESDPQNGSVEVDSETGAWVYTPAADFFGEDAFSISVTDSEGNRATREINVTVVSVNDAPVVVDDVAVTDEDVSISGISVLVNDSDIESDPLTVQSATSVNGGIVTINADGTLDYAPPANFNGTDTIEYVVADGNGGETAGAVLVTVNAVDDDVSATPIAIQTDYEVAATGNLADASIAPDKPVTYSLTPGAEPQHGELTINADGSFSYQPDAGFSGRELVGYTVTDDDGDSASSTIAITVNSEAFSANSASDLPETAPEAADQDLKS